MRTTFILVAVAAVAIARCTPSTPPPAVIPIGEARYLIDPRTGFNQTVSASTEKSFDAAWRAFLAGDLSGARSRLDDIRSKDPAYAPALLAQAAIGLRQGNIAGARSTVDHVRTERPQYLAAQVYDAEIAIAENHTQAAYDLYRQIAARADAPPAAAERAANLQTRLFEQLYNAALTAPDDEAIGLLRQALVVNPAAGAARVLLAQKLVALKRYEESRREIDPVLGTGDLDRPEVQEVLAEIEVSRGRFEEAIARYERIVRRRPDPRYVHRLDEIKTQFAEANMPPQFTRAVEDESITRADLAVIMYWKVASVRFAQNLATPPIAIDITEMPGRDEIVRAIALGVYQVDPVTRRVNPSTPVSAGALTRIAARLLAFRGAPCARSVAPDPTELGRAQKILAACGVTDPSLAGADLPVSGRTASIGMEQVDQALK